MSSIAAPKQSGWYGLDGEPLETIAMSSRACQYGDGFFTTIRVCDAHPQLLHYHMQRLQQSSKVLALDTDRHAIQAALLSFAQNIHQGIIKVHVSRQSDGTRGYTAHTRQTDVAFMLIPMQPTSQTTQSHTLSTTPLMLQPATAAVVLSRRLSLLPTDLAGLKTLNRLDNVLAAQQLTSIQGTHPDAQIGAGILCSLDNQVVEAVSSNLFFQYHDQWFTPNLAHAGVAGTMRQAICDHADIDLTPLPKTQLTEISAAFLCNALRGIQPIHTVYDTAGLTITQINALDTAAVEALHAELCDNAAFMAALQA